MRVTFKISFPDLVCPLKPHRWKRRKMSKKLIYLDLFLLPTLFSWHLLLGIASSASKGKHVAKWYIRALYNILIHFLKGTTSSSLILLTSTLLYSSSSLLLIPQDTVVFPWGTKAKRNSWCFNRFRYCREFPFLTMPLTIAVQGLTVAKTDVCILSKNKEKQEADVSSICHNVSKTAHHLVTMSSSLRQNFRGSSFSISLWQLTCIGTACKIT